MSNYLCTKNHRQHTINNAIHLDDKGKLKVPHSAGLLLHQPMLGRLESHQRSQERKPR